MLTREENDLITRSGAGLAWHARWRRTILCGRYPIEAWKMLWTHDMSVGIPEIDEQHQELFACLARVEAAIDEKQQGSAVFFALDQLADYARIHFAVEEIEMRIHRYPDFDAHVREHRTFESRIKQFSEEALHRNVFEEVREFLKDCLVEHIKVADKAYAPYLVAGNPKAGADGDV